MASRTVQYITPTVLPTSTRCDDRSEKQKVIQVVTVRVTLEVSAASDREPIDTRTIPHVDEITKGGVPLNIPRHPVSRPSPKPQPPELKSPCYRGLLTMFAPLLGGFCLIWPRE